VPRARPPSPPGEGAPKAGGAPRRHDPRKGTAQATDPPMALGPATPAALAYRHVLRSLLDVVEARRRDVLLGDATEALHELRVAVRRSRTLVAAAGGVLPARLLEDHRRALRRLTRRTNRARDLDVWLDGWADTIAGLAPADAQALAPLYRRLLGDREREWRRARQVLRSRWCERMLAGWRNALEPASPTGGPQEPAPPLAAEPVGDIARAHVREAVGVMLAHGARIDDGSPPADLHELRKLGKRLRYLLEASSFALPAPQVERLTAELRRLQDVLGEHQDRAVQAAALRSWAAERRGDPPLPAATLFAMGVLAGRLEELQAKARLRYAKRFRAFEVAALPATR
jgi:CHAD domain-containing protein